MSNPHSQFMSRATGNPTKKHTIYFTCPITERFKYGKAFGKEVVAGPQDHRDKVRKVLGWAIKDRKINADEYNLLLEEGYEHIKKAEKEERNKKLLNPEWVAWNEENRPKVEPKPKKTKEPKEDNKIKELTEQLEQMKRKNAELMKRKEHYKKLYNELLNKTEPEPEPEKTNLDDIDDL